MSERPEEIEWDEHILVILDMFGIHDEGGCREHGGVPCHVWVHDRRYRIVYANHAFRQTFRPGRESTCHQILHDRLKPCRCCRSTWCRDKAGTFRCAVCRRAGKGLDINVYHTSFEGGGGEIFHLKSSLFIGSSGLTEP